MTQLPNDVSSELWCSHFLKKNLDLYLSFFKIIISEMLHFGAGD